MQELQFNQGLLAFIAASPTPFHAVKEMALILENAGFLRLDETEAWHLLPGGKYYTVRNASSLIAFCLGKPELHRSGIRMCGAHTDSPCLKIKPRPEMLRHSYLQLGVEVYGGALLNPWFDRDLSLAGRVSYINWRDEIESGLVDFRRPLALIPSLAIHLDREANKNRSINPQEELPPLLLQIPDGNAPDFREMLLMQLKKEHPHLAPAQVLDYEISLYDTQPPALTGLEQDFISGARLDNLMSCYTGLRALLHSGEKESALLVCSDHEEVGSSTAAGAQGTFLPAVLERICPDAEDRMRMICRSLMISADDAHGIHPNYAGKYDSQHGPILNRGPVIKFNAGRRYATDSESAALFRHLCMKAGVPVQEFVMRADMVCGSTIGPIAATQIGIKTVDVGIPVFAMHSIRETAGARDAYFLFQVLCEFYQGSQA
ncbi:MAG: M18 family aminopeptidase [Desulfococcaceae bacterium]|jgi:aspartyl aminopeptidase|nr:M18 family aminopeptidase [Desulfococcaceae bacterium]